MSGAGANAEYPPQSGYSNNAQPPPNEYSDSQYHAQQYQPPPRHAQYDPMDGYPIPPGYVPPHNPPPSSYDPHNFPPPPRESDPQGEYRDDGYERAPPRSDYDRNYDDRGPPRSEYGPPPSNYQSDRPYAPSDPRGHEGNQLAPYDEEKADAEYRRGYEEDQRRYYGVPPPPSDYELGRRDTRRSYDDRDDRYDDRYSDYSDRDRRYDDRDRRYDDRDRDRDRRRRDSRKSPTKSTGKDFFGGKEGERGIGAQILGGAAGGWLGHEMGKGPLETLGGVVVGALGAKVLENQHEKMKSKKIEQRKQSAPFKEDAMYRSGAREVRDDRREYRPEPSSRSRGATRSRSRRRRSDSYSSEGSRSPPPPRR